MMSELEGILELRYSHFFFFFPGVETENQKGNAEARSTRYSKMLLSLIFFWMRRWGLVSSILYKGS